VLAALIAFQNEGRIQPRPPMVRVDRGGGGALGPRYEIVDYIAVLAAFPEVAGEDPVSRAARRQRFLEEGLPLAKAARDRRDGAIFLAGAQLGEMAAAERFAAERERVVAEAFDAAMREIRLATPAPPPAARSSGSGVLLAAALGVGAGIAIGILLARRRKERR